MVLKLKINESNLPAINYITKCAFKAIVCGINISIVVFQEQFPRGNCHELFLV